MSKSKTILVIFSFLFGSYNGVILPVAYPTTPDAKGLIEATGILLLVILIKAALLYYNKDKEKRRKSVFSKFFEYLHIYYFLAPFFISAGLFGLFSTLIRNADSTYYLISLFTLLGGVLFSTHFVGNYIVTKKEKT